MHEKGAAASKSRKHMINWRSSTESDIIGVDNHIFFLSFFIIFNWPLWPHSMLIIWWRCYKSRTEAIEKQGSFPLLFYIFYRSTPRLQLLLVVSSFAASSP